MAFCPVKRPLLYLLPVANAMAEASTRIKHFCVNHPTEGNNGGRRHFPWRAIAAIVKVF
jgi:hypothetical protein